MVPCSYKDVGIWASNLGHCETYQNFVHFAHSTSIFFIYWIFDLFSSKDFWHHGSYPFPNFFYIFAIQLE